MIDNWFKKDLEKIYEKNSIVVFIDESKDAEFLLKCLDDTIKVIIANSEIDELHARYVIEKDSADAKYLIYTNTTKDKLKFIREYCETNGCVEIKYLQNYIKEKVYQTLKLNLNMSKEELISAAKVSIGKDQTYWMDLSHKGSSEIFDLEKELLSFLNDPKIYSKSKYDEQLIETFFRKVNEYLKKEYIKKPPETLANEVAKVMLDGIAYGKCDKILEKVYYSWLDSLSYKKSFSQYLSNYKIPIGIDIWKVPASHPFRDIDEQWLKEISSNINNKEKIQNYLSKINQRAKNEQANSLQITFWKDVEIMLSFDSKDISYLCSLKECIDFYTKHFYKIDSAIRNLYTEFLNKKDLLEPFQNYYKNLIEIFLEKWFFYFKEYKQNQTGIIQKIIDENDCKTAIIVGDGINYEIAQNIIKKVPKSFNVVSSFILADIPSETENNMSQIYMANGIVESIHSKREVYLEEHNHSKKINFINLDEVSKEETQAQYLICTYKDIDDMGEKLQHKALKYFSETELFFTDKIELLLKNGYKKVYLITDHGFVLSGILSDADKISVDFSGQSIKSERYIRTIDKQQISSSLIEVERKYEEFNYIYFSKTLNPFKTPGKYGYSHGGLSPQELITPYIYWETNNLVSELSVSFIDKIELQNVTGELYKLKINASSTNENLFSVERKIYLVFFSDGKQISKSDIITIKVNERINKDYSFDGMEQIEVQLLDAESKEQLDSVKVKRNNDRDLGGLLQEI